MNRYTEAELLRRNVHCLLGIPLDMATMKDVVTSIGEASATKKGLFISTANLNFIVLAQRDDAFRHSLIDSDLCLTDGIALKVLGTLLGIPIPERVAGSDILDAFREQHDKAEQTPLRVFFFGGTKEANERASAAVNRRYSPAIECVGNYYPGFVGLDEMSSDDLINQINASEADFLIVALGAQKGQAWIARNLEKLKPPVVSHLGATINFLAGTVKRAPALVQKLGLEWLWRIKEEPKLAARYWNDGVAVLGLLMRKVIPLAISLTFAKWRHGGRGLTVNQEGPPSDQKLTLKGAFAAGQVDQFKEIVCKSLPDINSLRVDLSSVSWADTKAMGTLLMLSSILQERGGQLILTGATKSLRRSFALNRLGELL